jgi:hypothetical protein
MLLPEVSQRAPHLRRRQHRQLGEIRRHAAGVTALHIEKTG